jgi:hypothetical protein
MALIFSHVLAVVNNRWIYVDLTVVLTNFESGGSFISSLMRIVVAKWTA